MVYQFIRYIYTYIPEEKHVSRIYSVAPLLWSQYRIHVMLIPNVMYFYISTFRIICAVTNTAFSYYYYYYYYCLSSPWCKVFTI